MSVPARASSPEGIPKNLEIVARQVLVHAGATEAAAEWCMKALADRLRGMPAPVPLERLIPPAAEEALGPLMRVADGAMRSVGEAHVRAHILTFLDLWKALQGMHGGKWIGT